MSPGDIFAVTRASGGVRRCLNGLEFLGGVAHLGLRDLDVFVALVYDIYCTYLKEDIEGSVAGVYIMSRGVYLAGKIIEDFAAGVGNSHCDTGGYSVSQH